MPIRPDRPLFHAPSLQRLAVVLALVLAAGSLEAAMPAPALGASTLTVRCSGTILRTRPSTSARIKVRLKAGTKVYAVSTVPGSRWRTNCAGHFARGGRWYRITSINGRSVKSRYGVKYLYAATSLFRRVSTPVNLWTKCDAVNLRASSSTTATIEDRLDVNTAVVASATVTGSAWSATCGSAVSGTSWYRISSVNGQSVSSLYGVSSVYGAAGLFQTTPPPTPTPTPDPTPTTAPDPTPSPTPTPMPDTGYIEGIDISHWQGTIDWTAVAASGRQFAFMKASDGLVQSDGTMYVDPTYTRNRKQGKAVGLVVGAYHFARPDATPGDAVAEADHFADTLILESGDLHPVLDLEQNGNLGVSDLQAWVRAFLDELYVRTGVRGMIYVSPNFWSNRMGNTGWFAANGYDMLWIAHWTTAAQPTVPANNWGGHGWTFWQYTSDGSVPGISGRVDLDHYRFSDLAQVEVP